MSKSLKQIDIMNLSAAEFQPIFPIEIDFQTLPVNSNLPILQESIFNLSGDIFTVEVKVPDILRDINIVLLVNNKKYDIYFNVSGGVYVFKQIKSKNTIKNISVLYFNKLVKSETVTLYSRSSHEIT